MSLEKQARFASDKIGTSVEKAKELLRQGFRVHTTDLGNDREWHRWERPNEPTLDEPLYLYKDYSPSGIAQGF